MVVVSLGEIDPNLGAHPYLLAWEEDGRQLSGEEAPVKLVTPGDLSEGRYVYGIAQIDIRDASAIN